MSDNEYIALNKLATRLSYVLRDRGNLETRNNDNEDFVIVPIWDIKNVVIAAYELGKENNVKF